MVLTLSRRAARRRFLMIAAAIERALVTDRRGGFTQRYAPDLERMNALSAIARGRRGRRRGLIRT